MSHKEPHLICCCKDGPQGATGLQGPHGNDGVQGVQGIQGPLGPQGVQGAIGIDGIQGIPGDGGTNNTTLGSIGVQGPEGPEGNYGTQGISGVNGVDGLDGTAGANFQAPLKVNHIFNCPPPEDFGFCTQCLQCYSATANSNINGIIHFIKGTGTGFAMLSLPFSPVPAFGEKIKYVSIKGQFGYIIRTDSGNSVELSAYNSFTNNIAVSGPLVPPYNGMFFDQASGQGSNCLELLHIGGQRWVVIKINLNNGQLPLFI